METLDYYLIMVYHLLGQQIMVTYEELRGKI